MAAPLNTCTMIEQRGIMRFLWAKDMAPKDIHKEMLPMYGEHCLSHQAVHNWVQKFLEGRTSIEDEHWVGWPVQMATPATLQRIEDIIRADRRVTIDAVATAIGCSHKCCLYVIPIVCFQSRFVTYLLTFPRNMHVWRLYSSGWGYGPVVDSFEQGNEILLPYRVMHSLLRGQGFLD